MSEQNWKTIEKKKSSLLSEIVSSLDETEYKILEATLQYEHEQRHLHKPHKLAQKIQDFVERAVK